MMMNVRGFALFAMLFCFTGCHLPEQTDHADATEHRVGAVSGQATSLIISDAQPYATVTMGAATTQLYAVAPGVAGQVYTSNGPDAEPTFQEAGTGGGGTSISQWITALDINFQQQPAQLTLPYPTGNFTVADAAVFATAYNSDVQNSMIISDAGLIFTPSMNTGITGSTLSASLIYIKLASVIPNFTVVTPIRLWVWIAKDNPAANFDQAQFGLFVNPIPTFSTNQWVINGFRGYAGGTLGWGESINFFANQAAGSYTSPGAPPAQAEVGMISFPQGIAAGSVEVLNAAADGGVWPDGGTFAVISNLPSNQITLSNSTNPAPNPLNTMFFLTALRNGSSTAYIAAYGRIRIDYIPGAL